MANRLADSTSPYLLQHKDNPVDWWQWGPDALTEAERLSKPILLSIGYAACHWCHVMAHESFEDDEVAGAINANFVPIKVDREERPDLDAIYMSATTAMTGHGGWPMTCFLTPAGAPSSAVRTSPKSRSCSCSLVFPTPGAIDEKKSSPAAHTSSRHCAQRPPSGRVRLWVRSSSSRLNRRSPAGMTRSMVVSVMRRSSHRRWFWSSCCAIGHAPARNAPC